MSSRSNFGGTVSDWLNRVENPSIWHVEPLNELYTTLKVRRWMCDELARWKGPYSLLTEG